MFFEKDIDFSGLSPLTLAFLGDAVYDILAREYVVGIANRPTNELNKMSVSLVNATAQYNASKVIMDMLSDEELAVYKRGRNAHANHGAKSAGVAEYHASTGLEALFGYLYLKGETERIVFLFNKIIENKK